MNSADEIVLAGLQADQKTLEKRLENLRKPIAQLEADLEHIKGAIAFRLRNASNTASNAMLEVADAITEVMATIPSSRLKGLNHADAVVAIAKYNGGVVRTQDAKRIMIKAGIMSKTKNSTNMAHNAIKRSGKFEKVSPGEYRLKSEDAPQVRAVSERELLPLRPPVN